MINYLDVIKYDSYGDRLKVLQNAITDHDSPHFMSNPFYKSHGWKVLRKEIIFRDLGYDLGVNGMYINGPIIVHHISLLTIQDIEEMNPKCLDPNNLISVSIETHNKIHYGFKDKPYIEREEGDTDLWQTRY